MTITTLIRTLSSLGFFATIVVGLVWNMFKTFTFLGQSGARCLELEQIIQGYLNGILVGLIGFVITSATGSTTLVGTIGIVGSSLFLYDKFLSHDLFYHNLNKLIAT